MKKYCLECGQQFDIEPNENYKTLCKSCFSLSKKSEFERLQKRLERLEIENTRLRLQTISGISPELLKKLKQLCHPDKHGNSQLSTAVFSELNRF